ncbi:SCO family protein [Rhodohalobacter sp. 8-1]|uniref:SCO family protein n=1 Tax=Rhodohalobacter sp. 8-1 TaxID=3131972 RepID=UPI0030ED9374
MHLTKLNAGSKILVALIVALSLQSCGPDRLDDYGGESFFLVNQDGQEVTFPDDFEGAPLIVGFIYTNCPDICSFITANVRRIENAGTYPDGTQFALITFDPERDRPDVLKSYAAAFEMDKAPYQFLTGNPEEIERLMKRVSVRKAISSEQETENGDSVYFLSHSDKILLLDSQSRLVFDYGGSMTPVDIVAEDLSQLQ